MNLEIRLSIPEDRELMRRLLADPDVLAYFPMENQREIDESVRVWEIFCNKGSSLTAVVDGTACGIAYLNLHGYKKISHQCILTIIVDGKFRNRGVGRELIERLCTLGKETFGLEMVHLEVYETNPAIRLYLRAGFTPFGLHKEFIKENGKEGIKYFGKTHMERRL